jgi:hypothetical protein
MQTGVKNTVSKMATPDKKLDDGRDKITSKPKKNNMQRISHDHPWRPPGKILPHKPANWKTITCTNTTVGLHRTCMPNRTSNLHAIISMPSHTSNVYAKFHTTDYS